MAEPNAVFEIEIPGRTPFAIAEFILLGRACCCFLCLGFLNRSRFLGRELLDRRAANENVERLSEILFRIESMAQSDHGDNIATATLRAYPGFVAAGKRCGVHCIRI